MEKKYTLPKEFATKWVEALRSGDYEQGNGELKTPYKNNYCCLGVACQIADVKRISGRGWIGYKDSHFARPNKKIPPLLIGDCNENKFVQQVSSMNDNGKTFTYIANFIEKNVEFI